MFDIRNLKVLHSDEIKLLTRKLYKHEPLCFTNQFTTDTVILRKPAYY